MIDEKPVVLGMAGLPKSGKDYASNLVIKAYSLATPPKVTVRVNMSDPLVWIATNVDRDFDKSTDRGRRLLQEVGRAIRAYDEDYLIRTACARANVAYDTLKTLMDDGGHETTAGVMFISGIRFPNEIKFIRDTMNGAVVWMERPGNPIRSELNAERMADPCETSMSSADCDYAVVAEENDEEGITQTILEIVGQSRIQGEVWNNWSFVKRELNFSSSNQNLS